jgi:hypothetical protein
VDRPRFWTLGDWLRTWPSAVAGLVIGFACARADAPWYVAALCLAAWLVTIEVAL